MKEQKLIRLLREMLRNSKRSDRELAKILGVSQPTVSRTRARIQILAFTFSKLKSYPSSEEVEKMAELATEWTNEHPNVIFSADGEGLGKDVVMISFHKDYAQYSDFMRNYAMDWGQIVNNFNSFLVSLGSGFKLKPLDLKYLADDL